MRFEGNSVSGEVVVPEGLRKPGTIPLAGFRACSWIVRRDLRPFGGRRATLTCGWRGLGHLLGRVELWRG